MALAFSDGWLDLEFICLFLLKVISSPEVWKSGNHEQNHNAHEGYLRGTEFAREEKQPQIKKSIVQWADLPTSAGRLQHLSWIAFWNTLLNDSVGYPLLSNLLQKVLFFPPMAGKVSQFHYAGGLGTVSFERFVCLASGPNYLPCWALISVSERRENNLYNSSRQLEAELWDWTKLSSIPRCQFTLIKCNRGNVAVRYCENRKALPTKWENSYWTSFINPEVALQRFSCNYAMLGSPHHMAGHWSFRCDVNLICSVDICLFC